MNLSAGVGKEEKGANEHFLTLIGKRLEVMMK
jgi:hypothetical protein